MQLHPALNLLDIRPVRPCMKFSEHRASVHGLCMLAPVQEPWRLLAADNGGEPARALPRIGAHPTRKPLAYLGDINSTWKQGGVLVEGGGEGRLLYEEGGRQQG